MFQLVVFLVQRCYIAPLLFAYDIKLLMQIGSTADARQLQMNIDNVLIWSGMNRLPFNNRKCEVIMIGDSVVERNQEVCDLGIPVDQKFTLIAHMERSITAARKSMGFIKSVSKGQFVTRALVVLYDRYWNLPLLYKPHTNKTTVTTSSRFKNNL